MLVDLRCPECFALASGGAAPGAISPSSTAVRPSRGRRSCAPTSGAWRKAWRRSACALARRWRSTSSGRTTSRRAPARRRDWPRAGGSPVRRRDRRAGGGRIAVRAQRPEGQDRRPTSRPRPAGAADGAPAAPPEPSARHPRGAARAPCRGPRREGERPALDDDGPRPPSRFDEIRERAAAHGLRPADVREGSGRTASAGGSANRSPEGTTTAATSGAERGGATTSAGPARTCQRAGQAQPPATAGKIVTSSPSATGVARPSRKRMSSPSRRR